LPIPRRTTCGAINEGLAMITQDSIEERQIAYAQRSLDQMEQAWGRYNTRLIPHMQYLADLQFALRQYPEAEAMCLRLLSVVTKNHGYNHPAVASALQMIGEVCEMQNLPLESERYYLWALEVRMQINQCNEEFAEILARLANLYRAGENRLKSQVIENKLMQVVYTASHEIAS
jgi:hypothetical protein